LVVVEKLMFREDVDKPCVQLVLDFLPDQGNILWGQS
jgi:hypothetical protein